METQKINENDFSSTENTIIDPLNNIVENNLNIDPLSTLDENKIVESIEKKEDSSKINKLFKGIIFTIKYVGTTTLIFVILLLTTNYSAYVQIAKSYLNPNEIETKQNSLLKSTNMENTEEKQEEEQDETETTKDKTIKEEEQDETEIKNFHSMDKLLHISNKENIDINIDIVPYENRIIIPKIGKNIPLLEVQNKKVKDLKELENIFMKELENGIVRYPTSAKPGEDGNIFIFGHSSNFPWAAGDYNDVFALLDKVIYDDIIVAYYDQKKYVYKVREKRVISPGDIKIIKRNQNKSEITLMTCFPIGTSLNRLIVIGELVEENKIN